MILIIKYGFKGRRVDLVCFRLSGDGVLSVDIYLYLGNILVFREWYGMVWKSWI